jgi:hypothetical protein
MTASPEKSFNVSAHGFSASDALTFNGGSWSLALADASGTLAIAIVSEVADADNFTAYALGGDFVTITSHGAGSAGDVIYLSSATSGGITTTAPSTTGEFQQWLGIVVDANTLLFQSFEAQEVL